MEFPLRSGVHGFDCELPRDLKETLAQLAPTQLDAELQTRLAVQQRFALAQDRTLRSTRSPSQRSPPSREPFLETFALSQAAAYIRGGANGGVASIVSESFPTNSRIHDAAKAAVFIGRLKDVAIGSVSGFF